MSFDGEFGGSSAPVKYFDGIAHTGTYTGSKKDRLDKNFEPLKPGQMVLKAVISEEADPSGKSLKEPGAKGDAGKLRAGLVIGDFARALREVSKVGDMGSRKYTKSGWITVPDGVERYGDAFMRHWLSLKTGELVDPESSLSHLSHCAWNILAMLDLTVRELEEHG